MEVLYKPSNMGSGVSTEDIFSKAEQIQQENPANRCAKYLSKDYFNGLDDEQKDRFWRCIKTGIDNPSSELGCYAMTPASYDEFATFFDQVIQDYHSGDENSKHVTCWDISGVENGGQIEGTEELSMRIRVGRNCEGFNLPGMMDQEERLKFESFMMPAFDELKKKYGGAVYSLSPTLNEGENPNLISDEKYAELVDKHIMFKSMADDVYLQSAGISNDWPYGRGCWVSDEADKIVWFGEEDQLRIMCMKKGTVIAEVFMGLQELLETIESIEGIKFATSDKYGFVTSCPSNLGTGMRASVHVKCPNLTKDGTDAAAKEICGPLGLSVRGIGGEHTPIGADGTIDISPRGRLFIKECDILSKLVDGVKKLMEAEAAAGAQAPQEC